MRIFQVGSLSFILFLLGALPAISQNTASSSPQSTVIEAVPPSQGAPAFSPAPTSFNEVIERVVQREHLFLAQMRHMHPMVETYLQNLKTGRSGSDSVVKDNYFLGRLDMNDGPEDTSFIGQPGFSRRMVNRLTGLYALHFLPLGFAQMVVLDPDFQKRSYDFTFVRREFLGEVRCLVIDVAPKKDASPGRFVGRMWVEDQDYNIVRFNGTYSSRPGTDFYLHFDTWRLNLRSGMWVPAYIYSEESDFKYGISKSLHFRAQTRLWGYDLKALNKNSEFTQILVDSPQSVKDQSDVGADATPVVAERMWERQAEDNAVERLQKIGLLAPVGEVDKVLQTVVNNLLVTNNIDLQSDVRCRVLLTTPLESFTIGHTIVVSRGLLDVLPDEATLAAVLAHELAHIVLHHSVGDGLLSGLTVPFSDLEIFAHFNFRFDPADEADADKKGLELFSKSPYKAQLANAGLFLEALEARSAQLPRLLHGRFSNDFGTSHLVQMQALAQIPKHLQMDRLDQTAALPLGSRIAVDPWSDRIEMLKHQPVRPLWAAEKMPFEVSPFFPYLKRLEGREKAQGGTKP
jgi:hypothetical protein